MCDMMVLAFQTDRRGLPPSCSPTPAAIAAIDRSMCRTAIMICHTIGGDAKKHEKIRKINRFHVAQLAYLLEKLKATPDGSMGTCWTTR